MNTSFLTGLDLRFLLYSPLNQGLKLFQNAGGTSTDIGFYSTVH